MADPVYDGIDVITVTIALVLAAALVLLLAQIWRTAKAGIERIVVDVLRKYGALEPAPKAHRH
jgi:hypothetical protein